MQLAQIIDGGSHKDKRGAINFFNDFDMSEIKRFYIIENENTRIRRGWRGHKIEQRWFSVLDGEFKIQLIAIDNWTAPDKNLEVSEFLISAALPQVLHIPAGYATCIQALEDNSRILVFADYGVVHSSNDDYLFPEDYFVNTDLKKNKNTQ